MRIHIKITFVFYLFTNLFNLLFLWYSEQVPPTSYCNQGLKSEDNRKAWQRVPISPNISTFQRLSPEGGIATNQRPLQPRVRDPVAPPKFKTGRRCSRLNLPSQCWLLRVRGFHDEVIVAPLLIWLYLMPLTPLYIQIYEL